MPATPRSTPSCWSATRRRGPSSARCARRQPLRSPPGGRRPANSRTRGQRQAVQRGPRLGRPGMGTVGTVRQRQHGSGGSAFAGRTAGPGAQPSSPPPSASKPAPAPANSPLPSRPFRTPRRAALQAGGNINDVQAKTYARIQLSKANEYFPGTTERTLLVTGRLKQVRATPALGLRCRPGRGGTAGPKRAAQRAGCPGGGRCLGMGWKRCTRLAEHGAAASGPPCPIVSGPAAHNRPCRRMQVVAALGLILAKLLREGVAPLRWVEAALCS